MKDFQCVSKEELTEFVQSYPYPLERDLYMDWYSWNDFRDGRVWPESVVAMASVYDDEFKICKDYLLHDRRKPQTNYDLLIRKTPEELARFMADYDGITEIGVQLAYERWLDWLRREAE